MFSPTALAVEAGSARLSRETLRACWKIDVGLPAVHLCRDQLASGYISRNALASGARKPWASAQRLMFYGHHDVKEGLNELGMNALQFNASGSSPLTLGSLTELLEWLP